MHLPDLEVLICILHLVVKIRTEQRFLSNIRISFAPVPASLFTFVPTICDVPKHPHSVAPTDRWRCQRVFYLARQGCAAVERSTFEFLLHQIKVPQQSTQTVCLPSWESGTCNLSPRLKFVPGVHLDSYHLMNPMRQKILPLLSWGHPVSFALRRFLSQKLQM